MKASKSTERERKLKSGELPTGRDGLPDTAPVRWNEKLARSEVNDAATEPLALTSGNPRKLQARRNLRLLLERARSMTRTLTIRVVYPDGSSLLHVVAVDQTVRAALYYFRKRRRLPLYHPALAVESVEWVLYVPSTGKYLRAQEGGPIENRLLSATPYVQDFMRHKRTPIFHLCTIDEVRATAEVSATPLPLAAPGGGLAAKPSPDAPNRLASTQRPVLGLGVSQSLDEWSNQPVGKPCSHEGVWDAMVGSIKAHDDHGGVRSTRVVSVRLAADGGAVKLRIHAAQTPSMDAAAADSADLGLDAGELAVRKATAALIGHRLSYSCDTQVPCCMALAPAPALEANRTAPHRTAPHRTAPHRTTPHHTTSPCPLSAHSLHTPRPSSHSALTPPSLKPLHARAALHAALLTTLQEVADFRAAMRELRPFDLAQHEALQISRDLPTYPAPTAMAQEDDTSFMVKVLLPLQWILPKSATLMQSKVLKASASQPVEDLRNAAYAKFAILCPDLPSVCPGARVVGFVGFVSVLTAPCRVYTPVPPPWSHHLLTPRPDPKV